MSEDSLRVFSQQIGGAEAVDHTPEKTRRRAAVAHAVVEGQGDVDDLADLDTAVPHPGAVGDAAHPDHRGLGVVQDRRGAVDLEAAVVVQGEGAAGEVLGGERPAAGEACQSPQFSGEVVEAETGGVPDDRDHQAVVGAAKPRCTCGNRTTS